MRCTMKTNDCALHRDHLAHIPDRTLIFSAVPILVCLVVALACVASVSGDQADDPIAMKNAMMEKLKTELASRFAPGKSANAFTLFGANMPVPTTEYQLAEQLSKVYRRSTDGGFEPMSTIPQTINALLNCREPPQPRSGGGSEAIIQNCYNKMYDTWQAANAEASASPKMKTNWCLTCVRQKAKATDQTSGNIYCKQLGRSPMELAVNALKDASLYQSKVTSDDRTQDEIDADNKLNEENGGGADVTTRPMKFTQPKYDDIKLQLQAPPSSQAFTFTFSSADLKSNSRTTKAQASIGVNAGFFRGGASSQYAKINSKMKSSTIVFRYTIEQAFSVNVETPSAFTPTIVSDAVSSPRSGWKTDCNWDRFFGEQNGQMNYVPRTIIFANGVKGTVEIETSLTKEEFEFVQADVSASYWPYVSAQGSGSTQTNNMHYDGRKLSIDIGGTDNWSMFGMILGNVLNREKPMTKSIRKALNIDKPADIFSTFQLLKTMVGPVLAPSLSKPGCGVELLSCIHDMSQHTTLLQRAATTGDVYDLLQTVGKTRLCECATCLPSEKERKAKQALNCPDPRYAASSSGDRAPRRYGEENRSSSYDSYSSPSELTYDECESRSFLSAYGMLGDSSDRAEREHCKKLLEAGNRRGNRDSYDSRDSAYGRQQDSYGRDAYDRHNSYGSRDSGYGSLDYEQDRYF